jgi:hypothetical protein
MPERSSDDAARRRERWILIAIVVALVIWRCGVFVFWEEADFDSDQAIMGLMAKHLIEGRAFPVFMYGQNYILGVQAWMAAPMFLLFGVSVTSLKLPLLIINVAVAVLLVRLIAEETGLRPSLAAIASAPFILPAPGTAASLVEASGGNLEPFLYVILMWITRRNAWLCGVILGFGFMQRPFVIYGLMALLCVWFAQRKLFTRDGLEDVVRVVVGAAAMWGVIQGLDLISSPAGPGTKYADAVVALNNVTEVMLRTCIAPSTIPLGLHRLVTLHWPELLGTAPYRLAAFSIESRVDQGYPWASLLPAAAVLLALTGIVTASLASNARAGKTICGYLTLVGVFSAAGYVIARCGELSFHTMRYELLSLLGIVGLGAWFLRVARWKWMVRAWIPLVVCWTMLAAVSHGRLWYEYLRRPPVSDKHIVMMTLESRGVKYGTADYWIAYYISFLTKERIILRSFDFLRIRSYDSIVAAHAKEAVRVSRTACDGGRKIVEGAYLCPY